MKKVIPLLATSLALVAGSWWAFIHGASYEVRDYSPSERMQVLDTTTIAEQWMLTGGMMAALAAIAIILATAVYLRARKKALARVE